MKGSKEAIVDNDEILNIVNEMKILVKEDRYNKDSFKDLKKDYAAEIKILEEALPIYLDENDPKILKKSFLTNGKS